MIRTKTLAAMLAASLLLTGCDAMDREGMILLTDRSYGASMAWTARDGVRKPDGLLWRSGKLYFADEGSGTVSVGKDRGTPIRLAGKDSGISTPEDLAVDAAGNIFFTDDGAGGVWKIGSDGKADRIAGSDRGIGPSEGIAITASGDILVGDANNHRIMRVAQNGEVSQFLGPGKGVTKPESLAFDEAGNLFIADNEDDVLYLLGSDGELKPLIRERDGFSPETIWYSRGVLYITDSKHGKLFRYTPEQGLQTIAVFGGKLGAPCGITGDETGALYVSLQSDLTGEAGHIVRLSRTPV